MTRSSSALALLALAVLVTGGCDRAVGGSPQAAGNTSSNSTSSNSTPPNSTPPTGSTSPADPFAGLDPCALLDRVLAGQGYAAAKRSDADAAHNCDTKKTGYGVVGLALQPDRKIDENVTGKAVTGDVNGRAAVQERDALGGTGSCDVAMAVAPGARAKVLVTLQTAGTDEACRLAGDVATKVEPLLPAK